VVEDERIIALNLKENLESLGYAVPAIAATGEQAIAAATDLQPDLVLMDIRLKGAMDGIQAAEQIWERLQIPIIYVTGHSDRSTLERAKVTTPFGYVLKPVKERELYVAIETALQRYEREQLLAAIFRGMGDGVIVVDPNCRVRYLNQVAGVLTGWDQLEARDRPLTEVFRIIHEDTQQPMENPVAAALQQDTILYLQERALLMSRNGNIIPISDSVAPLRDNKGNITGAVMVFRDDTQRRLVEERNLAMERARQLEVQTAELQRLSELKDDFLATVSHELRTPLANIKLAVHMLEVTLDQQGVLSREFASDDNPIVRYLKILRDQCNQELSLVNDLLDLQRLNADTYVLELTTIRLQDWIPHVAEGFDEQIRQNQQSLQLNIAVDLPPLVSDAPSLTRILTELLTNACKYTPPGGTISITCAMVSQTTEQPPSPEQLETGALVQGADALDTSGETPVSLMFQLIVSNSGVEIPTEEQCRIFDPFYRIPRSDRWKHGGTGLGLALVKKLVAQLQGEISLTSQDNSTTFQVQFPAILSIDS
jgi:PAS domain S-box-containing protein